VCRQGQLDLVTLQDGKPIEDHTGLPHKLLGTVTQILQLVWSLLYRGAAARPDSFAQPICLDADRYCSPALACRPACAQWMDSPEM